ncbi:MAG: PEP-utilizing enzyme [Rhodobacteraceae bacterium]|nr:PEP-utilizing enzyme [Paracoccaceae bacterium]
MAVSIDAVGAEHGGAAMDVSPVLDQFEPRPLLSVRSSPRFSRCGGVGVFLWVGLNNAALPMLAERIGRKRALHAYKRHIRNFAYRVHEVEIDSPSRQPGQSTRECEVEVGRLLESFRRKVGTEFPQSPSEQLRAAVRTMAKGWNKPSARLLRTARGFSGETGLGLVVQEMVLCRSSRGMRVWSSQAINVETGRKDFRVGIGEQANSADIATADSEVALSRGWEDELRRIHDKLRRSLADEIQLRFADDGTDVFVLEYGVLQKSVAAEVRVAVELVQAGVIDKQDALLRIDPENLASLLHPQVSPEANNRVIAKGIAASPGAASGAIVFSSSAADVRAARSQGCILVRAETGPEDIRGMHIAQGVLTGRGGMTSHAAVIARGLGVPCVAGATNIDFWPQSGALVTDEGNIFREGDTITIDGTAGVVLEGAAPTLPPDYGRAVRQFLDWADCCRDLGIRANADTLDEVKIALRFGAEGVGLCRTEHMFFDESRLTVMREMIFASTPAERRQSLEKLLPMQRGDFLQLFQSLPGKPVCIRLLDPPLHEFLPHDQDELADLAEAIGLSLEQLTARAEELKEFNPMLGLRGVRLGISVPEIYEMQARAIFEAAAEATARGISVSPEIMVPLVTANREVVLVKRQIDQVAEEVRASTGVDFEFELGVMVETPRAALRAGELAANATFLSFGTNDLTQLTYGISRDDSARIVDEYVRLGVFPADPFSRIDREGVGELLQLAVSRGMDTRPDLLLSLCGEHAASADTIEFSRQAKFSYVSCSPFRVPIARLAAAQAAIRQRRAAG